MILRRAGLYSAVLLTVLMVVVVPDADAIIRRHDRDDKRYLALGVKYPAVVQVGGATGTLVANQWIITAAHVAHNISPFERQVKLDGQRYEITGCFTHPAWQPGEEPNSIDIGLVRLNRKVNGVTPMALGGRAANGAALDRDGAGHDAPPERAGDEIILLGMGRTGDGLTGPTGEDGRCRAATNLIREVTDRWIVFNFDAPPDGTDLEGVSGPGDSGGPAFVIRDGKPLLVGISSANDSAGAAGPCRYHSIEYYSRVAAAREWIDETLKRKKLPRDWRKMAKTINKGRFPDSRGGEVAAAFFKAYGQGELSAMEAFESEFRSATALSERPASQRAATWMESRSDWGDLTPLKYVEAPNGNLHVLLRAAAKKSPMALEFVLNDAEPRMLAGVRISPNVQLPAD